MTTRAVYRIAKFTRSSPSPNVWLFASERVVDQCQPEDLPQLVAKDDYNIRVVSKYLPTSQDNVLDFHSSWVVLPRWLEAPRPTLLTRLICRFFKL